DWSSDVCSSDLGKGEAVEGGIVKTVSLRTDIIEDAKVKESLSGLKKDDVVSLDLKKAYDSAAIARLLEIEEDKGEELEATFEVKIENINRLEEADMD